MSAVTLYYPIDGSLTSVGWLLIGLFVGIIYTLIFALSWITECAIMKFAKK